MDKAKQHWPILAKLGTDFANRVREFMVIGSGVIVVTEDGQGFWFGTIKFGWIESITANEPTPLDVPGELVSMAQNDNHILLLNKRGEIYSMGLNGHGQLGVGIVDGVIQFYPQLIPIPQHKFISVRCGRWHSLALTEDGKCWTWGSNRCGQLGVPSSSVYSLFPSQILEFDPHQIVAIECGTFYSLALTERGEVYSWGRNDCGQLGDGSRTLELTPTRIPIPSPVQSIAAGDSHTLLLTQTGEVWACGNNGDGQLGRPRDINFSSDLSRVLGLPPILQIASHPSSFLSIAMTSYNRCYVWGVVGFGKSSIFTPHKLPPAYSTVDSSFSFYRSTPHSVTIPEIPPSRFTIQMSRMFVNPETSSDVQFVVEQRTIHAHRIILSNSSDYFARMFSERWMAPVDPEDPIVRVTIADHSYQVFHTFLRFLYTDSFVVHPDLLPEMFELANQYLVLELQQLCLSQMRSTLTKATCCLYYPLTHRHSLPELNDFQEDIVKFASNRMWKIAATSAYQSMEPDLRDSFTNAAQNCPHFPCYYLNVKNRNFDVQLASMME